MMYHNDKHAPHFHAKYGEYSALIAIDDGAIIAGRLPIRAYHLVLEWLALHRRDLLINWERARQQSELTAIEGLS
jgi:hypothetical protein